MSQEEASGKTLDPIEDDDNSNSNNELETPSKNDQDDNKSMKKASDPVIPWLAVDHEIGLKTFTGYNLSLNGWVRRDVLDERRLQKNVKLHEDQKENSTDKDALDVNKDSQCKLAS